MLSFPTRNLLHRKTFLLFLMQSISKAFYCNFTCTSSFLRVTRTLHYHNNNLRLDFFIAWTELLRCHMPDCLPDPTKSRGINKKHKSLLMTNYISVVNTQTQNSVNRKIQVHTLLSPQLATSKNTVPTMALLLHCGLACWQWEQQYLVTCDTVLFSL